MSGFEKIKIGMANLGCPKNQVDAELMMFSLEKEGFEICGDITECDAVIVNTCGFIEQAKQEAIETILDMARFKKKGKLKALIVTGCLAERYQKEIAQEMPEIDALLGIGSTKLIAAAVRSALAGRHFESFEDKNMHEMEGGRKLAGPSYTAYLRIADGCDNRCSYCAIPLIRGRFRSRRLENILEEAKSLAAEGVKELNIIAQDTTMYGRDIYGRYMLPGLLKELCRIKGIEWIRLLYCYPDHITEELLDTMAGEDKILNYIDLPLQHASGRILSAMNRKGDAESLEALIKNIRAKLPGCIIRTTLICGFPGENEEDFETLCSFVKKLKFERLGCFAYSCEEDTPAACFQQIDEDVKFRRAEHVSLMWQDIGEAFAGSNIGRTLTVLCEGKTEEAMYLGRSYMDAPDVVPQVFFTSEDDILPGDMVRVRITRSSGLDLVGERVL